MKCQLVDNLDKIGGQCAELYPDKPIYDIPAVPRCTGQELVELLMEQIRPFEPRVPPRASRPSAWSAWTDGRWRLTTERGHGARGAGGRDRRGCRQLRAAPAAAARRRRASRAARSSMPCAGWSSSGASDLLIAGGGNSALDWTLNLQPLASQPGAGPPPRRVPRGARIRSRRCGELVAAGDDGAAHRPDQRACTGAAGPARGGHGQEPRRARRWCPATRCSRSTA